MIQLTEQAVQQVSKLLAEESSKYVRVFIQGGGCSGFNYGFTFEDQIGPDDFEFNNIVVDAMSMQYLDGATIDYKKDLMSAQFVITNPNAVSTCGCGSSFAV